MKAELLKKIRKRFKFTDVNGYNEMLDKCTGIIHGPEWAYCRSKYSTKDHLLAKAIEIMTWQNRWRSMALKQHNRRQKFLRNRVVNA